MLFNLHTFRKSCKYPPPPPPAPLPALSCAQF